MKINDEFIAASYKSFGWERLDRRRGFVAIGLFFLVFGVFLFFYPEVPDFSGKFGWLYSWAYSTFGIYGKSFLYFTAGLVFIMFGVYRNRKEK